MDIDQLTANLHSAQLRLDQQIQQLEQQLSGADEESRERLSLEVKALEDLRRKLFKSRDVALQAHALQSSQTDNTQQPKRILGLLLCVFSGLGLLALLTTALFL